MKILKALSVILILVLSVCLLSISVFSARPFPMRPVTSIYDGILTYRVSQSRGITITKCDVSASGVVEIPAYIDDVAVTSIGDYSFQHCTEITGVIIPETITGIGYSAFYGCTALESIDIPVSVTKIEYGAFYNCKALKSATIADLSQWCAVEKDGEYANPAHITGTLILNGKPLTDVVIPDGITTVEDYTFYGCKSIESITIPDSVTSLGECAFYGCEKLDKMSVSAAVSEIGDGAFSACDNVTKIDIADTNTHYKNIEGCLVEIGSKTLIKGFNNGKIPADGSITRLGEYAFAGCEELTSIIVPDCIEVIGSSAFSNCEKLQTITLLAGLTVVRSSLFSGCTELSSIALPDTVETIGVSAFRGCTKLTDVTLSSSLTDIQNFAFAECSALQKIIIPKTVNNIGTGIFDGCENLWEFMVENGNGKYGSPEGLCLVDYSKNSLIRGSKYTVIPDFVTSISDYAFSGIKDMEAVGISDQITAIGIGAFENCESLKKVYYGGNDEKTWKTSIKISSENDILQNAKFVYGNANAPVVKHPASTLTPNSPNNDNSASSDMTIWLVVSAVAVVLIAGALVATIVIKKKKAKQ